MLSTAFAAAVRWGWITFNPLEAARKPRPSAPRPDPPSAEDAARIVAAAWEEDEDWGMFVWMTMVTAGVEQLGELIVLPVASCDGILTPA